MLNMPKNAFLHGFNHQFSKTAFETQIKAYAAFANVKHAEKNAFSHCIHHQYLKTALETLIKAYAAFANVKHAEKRVLALLS